MTPIHRQSDPRDVPASRATERLAGPIEGHRVTFSPHDKRKGNPNCQRNRPTTSALKPSRLRFRFRHRSAKRLKPPRKNLAVARKPRSCTGSANHSASMSDTVHLEGFRHLRRQRRKLLKSQVPSVKKIKSDLAQSAYSFHETG